MLTFPYLTESVVSSEITHPNRLKMVELLRRKQRKGMKYRKRTSEDIQA